MKVLQKKTTIFLILFSLFILVTGISFHNPVRIIDGLTQIPAEGFSVKISAARIIFEPVLGPFIFYLTADYPVAEFSMLLIWSTFLFLVLSLTKSLKNQSTGTVSSLLPGLKSWILRTPILVSSWMTILLILIFMPLPSNSISNDSAEYILVNIHSHTEYSHDGLISQKGLMKWHHYFGFDAFFITDHNHHKKTLEAVAAQRKGDLPFEPFILAGHEYSGSNHILLLGLQRDFRTKDLPDQAVIDSAHANNAIAIIAHWFDGERKTLQYYLDLGPDGFEVYNMNEGINYNRQVFQKIVEKCDLYNILKLVASDYHGYGKTNRVWNALKIPNWNSLNFFQKETAVMEILRNHQQDKIRLLVYQDRPLFDKGKMYLSPFYIIVNYFRSLNLLQILSWIVWLILFQILFNSFSKKQFRVKNMSLLGWGILGTLNGVFMAALGSILLFRIKYVSGFNNIYSEFGTIFLGAGLLFFIYSIILILMGKRKRKFLT